MPSEPPAPPDAVGWTFLTDHARVLLCLARDPGAPVRELAGALGVAERSVRRILADLEAAGYVTREREGRCARYRMRPHLPLRHPLESHRSVGALVAAIGRPEPRQRGPAEADPVATSTRPRSPARPAGARPRSSRSCPAHLAGDRRSGA
jgi:DNA-binding transcriptional ArsR family regulator